MPEHKVGTQQEFDAARQELLAEEKELTRRSDELAFGPSYEAGCPVCSSIADTIDPNAVHLAARNVTMLLVSRAPSRRSRPTGSGWLEP